MVKERQDYERGRKVSYVYDTLNRLKSTEEWQPERLLRTDYIYDNRGNLIREGWLPGMEKLHINNMRNMINAVKKKYNPESEAYGTAMLTEEFLNGYIKYINEHPEYYGCILE